VLSDRSGRGTQTSEYHRRRGAATAEAHAYVEDSGRGAADRRGVDMTDEARCAEEEAQQAGDVEEQVTVVCVVRDRGLTWAGLQVAQRAVSEEVADYVARRRAGAAHERPSEGELAQAESARLSHVRPGTWVSVRDQSAQGLQQGVLERHDDGTMYVRLADSGELMRYKANRVVKIRVRDEWVDVEPEVPQGCEPVDVEEGARLKRAEQDNTSVYRCRACVAIMMHFNLCIRHPEKT
jgi:hypothetical protein